MAGVKNKNEPRGRTKESIAPREQSKNICVLKSEATEAFLVCACWYLCWFFIYGTLPTAYYKVDYKAYIWRPNEGETLPLNAN